MKKVVKQMGKGGEFKVFDSQIINGQEDISLNISFANKKYKTFEGARGAIDKEAQYKEARG